MAFPYHQTETTDIYNERLPEFRLHHTSNRNRVLNQELELFDTEDMATRSASFDIHHPGNGSGGALLTVQSPGLLAFRNKTSLSGRPFITSPKGKVKALAIATPGAQTSLLVRRPLAALKDPGGVHALEVRRELVEQEKQTIAFDDDLIAYFSKRKDGRGHRFIYLVYSGNPSDPNFSPYELQKLTFAEIKGSYFTMSADGVTHVFTDGTTETISLDLWAHESSVYNAMRKLKFFRLFRFWRPFAIWRNFVMKQRYESLDHQVVFHPFFRNSAFFSRALAVYELQGKLQLILEKYLLAFPSQRKFRLLEFEAVNHQNIDKMKLKYDKFLGRIQDRVQSLYAAISDPKLVQVHDSDFPDIRRRNPNLAQLMVLEKRKATKREYKTDRVNREITAIGGFIRMIDYMLLESLAVGCVGCWKIAEGNVLQQDSSVFQLEVKFDEEGKVAFTPSLNDLVSSVSKTLHESLITLNAFPRILTQTPLRPFLRDNGLDMADLFDEGPHVSQIIQCSDILEKVESKILTVIKVSYAEGFAFAQALTDFYPIYKLGQSWNVRDYVFIEGGKRYEGPLTDSAKDEVDVEFLMKPELQPTIDIKRVEQDIAKFRDDAKRVGGLRQSAVKGVLHIDYRPLKAHLTPIPQKAISDLEELLVKLVQMKIDKLLHSLLHYSQELKQDPKALDDYIQFCELLGFTLKIKPQIADIIAFIQQMHKLFKDFQISHAQDVRAIEVSFANFQASQSAAETVRQDKKPSNVDALQMAIQEVGARLHKLHEKVTAIPETLKNAEVAQRLPRGRRLIGKVQSLDPRVQQLLHYQDVIEVKMEWLTSLRFRYLPNGGTISVEYSDVKIGHR
jgi:hypothetical protein